MSHRIAEWKPWDMYIPPCLAVICETRDTWAARVSLKENSGGVEPVQGHRAPASSYCQMTPCSSPSTVNKFASWQAVLTTCSSRNWGYYWPTAPGDARLQGIGLVLASRLLPFSARSANSVLHTPGSGLWVLAALDWLLHSSKCLRCGFRAFMASWAHQH